MRRTFLLLFAGCLLADGSALAQPFRLRMNPDTLLVRILDVPDSAVALGPIDFRIQYNTAGRDLCLNVSLSAYPTDDLPRNWSTWVQGSGEITYHHRIPSDRRASAFYVTAYLTSDGRWSGKEKLAWTYDHRSRIIPGGLEADWLINAPTSAAVDSPFTVSVHYALRDHRPRNIPYLTIDLTTADGRVAARHLEWSVPESATYRSTFTLPPTEHSSVVTVSAHFEDETLDRSLPPLESCAGPAVGISGGRAPDFGRVQWRHDTLVLDGKPSFLHGVNIFSFWNAWSDSTIRREFRRMRAAGFDFARVYLDWSLFQPSPGAFSEPYQRKIATLLRVTDSLGIWVELVPVGNWGGWIYDLYRDHWWTHNTVRTANSEYFEYVGRWLDSLDARNILYVSVMQEGSWYFDWFDPYTGREYPGAGALAEADTDWSAWLQERGDFYRTFDDATPELFGRWAGERFTDLLSLRARAFRRGSRGRFAIGAEGAMGGAAYDRRVYAKHVSLYALPELWAHVVDCFEVHSYTPISGNGYWSGSTGLRTYREWTAVFRKPALAGEAQWTWADASLDMSADTTWGRLREKLTCVRNNGYAGYAVWAWIDYDQRKLGFLDAEYQPRSILDSISSWIRGSAVRIETASPFHIDALGFAYPHPVQGSATVPFSLGRPGHVSITIVDLLGRRIDQLAGGFYDSGLHAVTFDTRCIPSGAYLCILAVDGRQEVRLFDVVK